jgi:hypothetical protein
MSVEFGRVVRVRGRGVVATLSVVAASAVAGVTLSVALPAAAPAGAGAGQASSAQLAQAKKDLLVHSDFPSGWSTQGSVTTSAGGGSSTFPGGAQLASCLGVKESLIDVNTPSANSPSFQTKGGVYSVVDSISLFSSAKLAEEANAAISSPKVPGCMTTVLQGPARQSIVGSAGEGVTIGTISVAAVPHSELTGHASGFTMSFPATDDGVTVNSAITVISVVRGKTGSQLTFESVGKTFPASLERHLVSVASGRI